jgi:uncharacterized protein (TIGR02246 family)
MRSTMIAAWLAFAAVAVFAAQDTPAPESPPAGPAAAAEPAAAAAASAAAPGATGQEKAIRGVAAAFVKAYNAGDAKALAALFTPNAEIVDEDGNAHQGRDAIEEVFAGIFKESPAGRIEISIGSIRFVSPTAAIEDGTSEVTRGPDQPAQRSRYTAVHVKQLGTWERASARDLSDETASAEEQLKPLDWLVGDWVDESPEALVVTSYRWTDNRCFLLGEFTVKLEGRPAMTGSQRIGWDPLARTIRSWVFDSEGGFGEGVWTRDGQGWSVKMTGVTREGKPGSSTNVTTRVSKDRMSWESRDRVVGGEAQPDVGPIPIVRKPPKPK